MGIFGLKNQIFSFLDLANRRDKSETLKIRNGNLWTSKNRQTQKLFLNPNILEPVPEGNCNKFVLYSLTEVSELYQPFPIDTLLQMYTKGN